MTRHGRAALGLALLTLAVLLGLAHFRGPQSRVWGDEGTFLAMMASLVEEGDLRFDERDLARIRQAEGGRTHVILQRDGDGVAYSKPVIYALAGVPFYALFGEAGPILLNAIAIAIAIAFAFAYLRRFAGRGQAALVLVTFVGGAVLLPYVAWRMTDLLQAAVSWIALMLAFAGDRGRTPSARGPLDRLLAWQGAPILGAVLLAGVVSMRISNGVLLAAAVMATLLQRRLRSALVLSLAAGVAYLSLAGLTMSFTGTANPYRAQRATFTPAIGYPAGADAEAAAERFDAVPARERTRLGSYSDGRRIAYSTFYFFLGRHTGLVCYFPAALIFLIFALRHADRVAWAALIALAGGIAFFLVWRTGNYFGGDTFIGNRYLLPLYPLLFVALPRLPGGRWLTAAWALAGLAYASALVSVIDHRELDAGSQSHTRAGIFRLLPYESTARDIVGRRDRYWAGHFLRFVDPFPGVAKWHVDLYAGRPPAELIMAHWRPLGQIRLYVETAAPEATLEVSDYGHRSRFPVGTHRGDVIRRPLGVEVDIEPSPAWRRHRYWWDAETLYSSRSLRLRLLTPGGEPARAVLRYFGDPALLEQSFSYDLRHAVVPERVSAGTTTRINLRIRNTGEVVWKPEDVVPTRYQYRIRDPAGELVGGSGRLELPDRVEPHHDVVLDIDVAWPDVPGTYRLELDLVLEHVAWFADRLGSPVLSREVVVAAAATREE